jgi:hypothetical protein
MVRVVSARRREGHLNVVQLEAGSDQHLSKRRFAEAIKWLEPNESGVP